MVGEINVQHLDLDLVVVADKDILEDTAIEVEIAELFVAEASAEHS